MNNTIGILSLRLVECAFDKKGFRNGVQDNVPLGLIQEGGRLKNIDLDPEGNSRLVMETDREREG